ncbi:MAG: iron chelate uptake ABC transporter family permease subunit, partial [Balneolaceae bacterium]|nr:iron chelate uptake ABC transporter family permease subunit [Balneolaceae bacterium]
LLGATLLVAADVLSRTLIAPSEIPIGILTALAGAPFFLWLLLRSQGGAWGGARGAGGAGGAGGARGARSAGGVRAARAGSLGTTKDPLGAQEA